MASKISQVVPENCITDLISLPVHHGATGGRGLKKHSKTFPMLDDAKPSGAPTQDNPRWTQPLGRLKSLPNIKKKPAQRLSQRLKNVRALVKMLTVRY